MPRRARQRFYDHPRPASVKAAYAGVGFYPALLMLPLIKGAFGRQARDPCGPLKMVDAEKRHARYPDAFEIPPLKERIGLGVGDFVKLILERVKWSEGDKCLGLAGERMWFKVLGRKYYRGDVMYRGMLDNSPVFLTRFKAGDLFTFYPRNVIDIIEKEAVVPASPEKKRKAYDPSYAPEYPWAI